MAMPPSPIPLLDLRAQYRAIQGEIDAALLGAVREQRFILGPEVEALEAEIARYVGSTAAVGVSSGSDALLLSLLAIGIGPGDEVITSDYSFFATAGSIVRCGARPVFVDIDPATYNMAPDQVASKVGPRVRALIPVHLFGRCAAVDEIATAAPGVPMIEDAAQAIGAELGGRRAGSLGLLGCFSFFPSKNLGGYGDGGLISTSDPTLAERIRALRVHGQSGKARYLHELVGGNFRLDALQAAVLRVKLRHLEGWTRSRREHADRYRQLFAASGADVVLPPEEAPGCRDVFNQFVIRVRDREGLRRRLQERGIGCAVYYPLGLHAQPCFADLGYREGDFPAAEAAARESLALPIYPELTDSQIAEVVEQVSDFLRR
jgi:dTDP-4-amino-4,6-dideoxygalactose transaminase